MSKHKFPYKWYLKDGYPAKGIDYHGLKVFGTFICGGGSSMGYKLAGYNHLGGVEIDPKVADIYKLNHNPKHLYIEDIDEDGYLTNANEMLSVGTFPVDYQGNNKKYLCAMSVPPVMTAQIAHQIYLQWLSKIPS